MIVLKIFLNTTLNIAYFLRILAIKTQKMPTTHTHDGLLTKMKTRRYQRR